MASSANVFTEFERCIPKGFSWLNPPLSEIVDKGLHIKTGPKTDFWQRTHYRFVRDDGHALLRSVTGNFQVTSLVSFEPKNQYDQCGLMIRVDHENWIKVSTEFEDSKHSKLGSVVTNLGWSDWATQTISSHITTMHYRASRKGSDFLLEYCNEDNKWQQMRIAHLVNAAETLQVGIYACSPIGETYSCCFHQLRIDCSEG